MVAPLYGYKIIKVKVKTNDEGKIDPYQSKFYTIFRRVLTYCLVHKKIVLSTTFVVFVISIFCMKFVSQE
ncbi:hypothetical protein RFZ33_11245, partial [Acinetobacter baumannii]|nr:hypothetical protein [Acinetobacter baumannii]